MRPYWQKTGELQILTTHEGFENAVMNHGFVRISSKKGT
jgi:hypothetical protein